MSSKSFKEINPIEPVSFQVTVETQDKKLIDWKLCILCQEQKNESLQCSANWKRKDFEAGKRSMAKNIQHFEDLGMMPFDVKVTQLDLSLLISSQI